MSPVECASAVSDVKSVHGNGTWTLGYWPEKSWHVKEPGKALFGAGEVNG